MAGAIEETENAVMLGVLLLIGWAAVWFFKQDGAPDLADWAKVLTGNSKDVDYHPGSPDALTIPQFLSMSGGTANYVRIWTDSIFGSKEDNDWHAAVNRDYPDAPDANGIMRHADGTAVNWADDLPSPQIVQAWEDGTILPPGGDPNDAVGNAVYGWAINNRLF
jgi:hypothetical protein